jgi:hypothetical protein
LSYKLSEPLPFHHVGSNTKRFLPEFQAPRSRYLRSSHLRNSASNSQCLGSTRIRYSHHSRWRHQRLHGYRPTRTGLRFSGSRHPLHLASQSWRRSQHRRCYRSPYLSRRASPQRSPSSVARVQQPSQCSQGETHRLRETHLPPKHLQPAQCFHPSHAARDVPTSVR